MTFFFFAAFKANYKHTWTFAASFVQIVMPKRFSSLIFLSVLFRILCIFLGNCVAVVSCLPVSRDGSKITLFETALDWMFKM